MSFSPSSPVTGAAQTGFTSPTYTLSADVAPTATGKQYAVTAVGGTQASVRLHSATDPFTVTIERPAQFKGVPQVASGATLAQVPRNKYVLRVRKGAIPVTGQAAQTALFELIMNVPAGSDSADPNNLRAALSLLFGVASQQAAGIGDTILTGIM
jgi:hypothetical protein